MATPTTRTRVRLAGGVDEVELLEQFGHSGLRLLRSEVAKARHQQEVFLAVQELVDRRKLAGAANHGAHAVLVAHNVASVHERHATVWPQQRAEDVHGRRLAGAVRAEQGGHGARAHCEVDVVELIAHVTVFGRQFEPGRHARLDADGDLAESALDLHGTA